MSDDELLSALGRVAAEQAADRERWERAASDGRGEREELARVLFAPASPASVDRLASRVVAAMGPPAAKKRARARWGLVAAPLLATAAAAAAWVVIAGRPPADLPGYSLSVSGGVKEARGAAPAAPGPVAVTPRSTLELLARPDARTAGAVHASAFVRKGNDAVPVASRTEASDKGALRVTIAGADLAVAAGGRGRFGVILVVGRTPESDARALAAQGGADAKGADWVRFEVAVDVEP